MNQAAKRRGAAGARLLFSVGALALTALLGGCVNQGSYDEMQTLYRQSQERIVELQTQLEQKESRIAALQEATAAPIPDGGMDEAEQARLAELEAELAELTVERDELAAELDRLEAALAEAEAQPAPARLEPELDQRLSELASSRPELMSYDRRLGLVRIRTDLTFPSGSAELRPGVRAALAELARILASREAAKYEVQVVGHTDNVPISNPQTRRNHPTNWHLSVHRAISVKDALADAGVAPVRMAVAGYGRFRPVVPNGPDGAEENRRVDVFLTNPTYPLPETPPAAGQAAGETGEAPAGTAPAQPRPEPPGAFK